MQFGSYVLTTLVWRRIYDQTVLYVVDTGCIGSDVDYCHPPVGAGMLLLWSEVSKFTIHVRPVMTRIHPENNIETASQRNTRECVALRLGTR